MGQHLARLVRYRGLLWILALGELKARHRQTLLGIFWALAQPVAMMLVFTIVFSIFVRVPVEGMPYALFAYTGLVSWLFFANLVSSGIMSVVANMNLVTKAGFPREVIPLSKVITVGFDFLVGLALLGVLLLIYGIPVTWAVLAVPAIVAIQVLFATGLVLLGSAVYVLRRDLGSLLPLLLQIWMFLSPVVYPVSLIPERYRSLYLLNPMATIIEAYRSAILFGTVPSLASMAPTFVIACAVFAAGYAYFKSVEMRFADVM
jgi:lipopolysaccharide transport system permease protein